MNTSIALATVALCALAPARAAPAGPAPDEIAARAKPIVCATLTTEILGVSGLTIASAKPAAADKGLPEACVVYGIVDPRVGADCKSYALRFEMRLPLVWNGRFRMGIHDAA